MQCEGESDLRDEAMSTVHDKVEQVVENTYTKGLGRMVLPALFAIIGTLGTLLLNDVRDSLKEMRADYAQSSEKMWDSQRKISDNLASTVTDLRVLAQRVDDYKARTDEAEGRLADQINTIARARQ